METLEVSKEQVVQVFEAAGKKTKRDLTILFGEKVFVKNIMERITSLEAALEYNGKTMERFIWETERDTDAQKADKELEEICTALREGKPLAMGDKWYYPYMRKPAAGSGSGFSSHVFDCDHDRSFVGSRHSVDTSEKAIYLGKQFTSIYTRRLSPNN